MAAPGVTGVSAVEFRFGRVTVVRIAMIIVLLAAWEALARSGLYFAMSFRR